MITYLGLRVDEEPLASLCLGCEYKEALFRIPPRRYLESSSRGFTVQYGPDRVVETIFLYGLGRHGYAQFAGDLLNGIKFGDSQERVHEALGPPTSSGSPGPGVFGPYGGWDRYDNPHHCIHFSYTEAGGLDLITLMMARAAPGNRPEDIEPGPVGNA